MMVSYDHKVFEMPEHALTILVKDPALGQWVELRWRHLQGVAYSLPREVRRGDHNAQIRVTQFSTVFQIEFILLHITPPQHGQFE